MSEATITAIAPWFGCARKVAEKIGKLMRGCNWVCVPFAGGMPELAHIPARTIMVSDLHRHVINLAQVAAHPDAGPLLYRRLKRMIFHPDVLAAAQAWCKQNHPHGEGPDLDAAEKYFGNDILGSSAENKFRGFCPTIRQDT